MKHLSESDTQYFESLLESANLVLEPDQVRILLHYADGVLEANTRLNLTRIDSDRAAIRLHLVDSLTALREVAQSPSGALLDIGTGGGFPGVPLCVASGRSGILLDSVAKKAHAVNAVLSSLSLDAQIQAIAQRAEDHAGDHRGAYAVVTARAVAQLPALVELASPLLMAGGRLVALKGVLEDDELDRARRVCELAGMRMVEVRHLELPEGGEHRAVAVFEREGNPSVALPRRVGKAQKSPLA